MSDVRLVSDAHALQSMRASDFDASTAYGEVVDNAIEASAANVRIVFDYDASKRRKPLRFVAFGDDGEGMHADELHRCLQLGYSSRFNSRKGIGRFGVGVTLAAINQCKRVELYSKKATGSWLYTYIDLDDIASGKQEGIPRPREVKPPEALSHLTGETSGTLMVWKKHDKQDGPADKTLEEFTVWAGRVYRHFIWDGVRIVVNGAEVDAIDPLYVTTEKTAFPEDPPAEELESMTITWPVPKQMDMFEGDTPDSSDIVIRMSLLPKELRPTQGAGNLRQTRERQIHLNEGVSILRNRREVFYGTIPWWPGKSFEEIDRWWGCEISFDAVLDYSFHVKNIKRGAVPLRELKKALSDKIEPTRKTALERVRAHWTTAKRDQEERDKDRRHARAERIAKKGDVGLPKGEAGGTTDVDKAVEQFTEQYLAGKSKEEKARWRELFESQPFTLEDDHWKGAEFVDIKHLGGRDVLLYNSNHLFHAELRRLEEELDGSAGDDDDSRVGHDLRALIDLVLISFSKAESMFPDEHGSVMEQLRMYWGNFLLQYIRAWKEG